MGIDVNGVSQIEEGLEDLKDRLESDRGAIVGASADHAAPIEFGSDPHTIEADDAEALHFEYEGEEVFVKSVEHPGMEEQPFLRPAARYVEANIEEYIEETESVEDAIKEAAVDGVRQAKKNAAVDDGDLHNSIRWEWL